MTAVLVLARRELRRRWRSALAMALFVGLVGSVVLASAAGAHRSGTALRRFIAYSRTSDAEVNVTDPTPAQLQAFRRVPEVADFAILHAYGLIPRGRPNLKNAATIDGRLGTAIDRPRVVAGRAADPNAPDEITIGEGLAAQQHLGLGDHLDAGSLTPAQFELANHGRNPGIPAGPPVRLRVVGIVRRPLDLGNLAASGGVVIETPAFDRTYKGRIAVFATILRVRTHRGAADVPRLAVAAREVFGSRLADVRDVSDESNGGKDAINVLTLALWVLAGVAALAGAVAIAIVLARDASQTDVDQPTLVALGLTRRQRVATFGLRTLLIALGGVIISTVIAFAASSMFPIGIARRAEPAPGLRLDGLILGVGAVGIAAFVGLTGFFAAIRVTHLSARSALFRTRHSRRTLADVAARAGLRPPVTNGLRLALDPGRRTTAVPVRSAFLGAVIGVVGLSAALVFASSLGHLDASPRLYGWTWDFKAPDDTFTSNCGANDFGLDRVRGVAAVAAVCYQDMQIDGRPTIGWGFTPVRGVIEPEIVAGRAPSGRGEVALGAATLHALGKKIGDTVTARGPSATKSYRVVGQIVLPPMADGDTQPLADGAAFTGAGFAPVLDPNNSTRYLVGDFAPGFAHAAVVHRIDAIPQFKTSPQLDVFVVDKGASGPARPPEVERLRHIDWFPPVLAVLIAVLSLVAVAHALVTTAHRRRSELALLKTLGFERRQVRATLAWQATTLATVGVVVGLPVGVLLGNLVWGRVADSLGISPAAAVPVFALALTVPCVIVVANVVAFWPARTAARTWPAVALRAE